MKTFHKGMATAAIGLLVIAGLAACSRNDTPSGGGGATSGGTKVDVGVIEDQTGTAATAGQENVCGIKIANDALAAGELPGSAVTLHVEDSQTTPAVAAQAATKLTGQGIKLFVGGTGTNTLLAQIPIINSVGGLTTGGVTKATQILSDAKYGFRLNGDTNHDSQTIATYLKELGVSSVAFLVEEGTFGAGVASGIKALLPSSIQVVDTVTVPIGATDLTSAVTQLKSENPGAIVWGLSGTAGPVAILRELKQQDVKAVDVPGAGLLSGSVVQAAGSAADGVTGFEVWSPTTDNAANDALAKQYKKYAPKHQECQGKTLDKQVALSYSQLALLAAAIKKSGSTDPATIRKTVVGNSWSLPQGTVTFDETGQAQVEYTKYTAKDGQLVAAK